MRALQIVFLFFVLFVFFRCCLLMLIGLVLIHGIVVIVRHECCPGSDLLGIDHDDEMGNSNGLQKNS